MIGSFQFEFQFKFKFLSRPKETGPNGCAGRSFAAVEYLLNVVLDDGKMLRVRNPQFVQENLQATLFSLEILGQFFGVDSLRKLRRYERREQLLGCRERHNILVIQLRDL